MEVTVNGLAGRPSQAGGLAAKSRRASRVTTATPVGGVI